MAGVVGDQLAGAATWAANAMTSLAKSVASFAESHPILTKTATLAAATAAGLLMVGGAALIMGGQFLMYGVPAALAIGKAFMAMSGKVVLGMAAIHLTTGGLLLIIGGVVTGIAAFVTWWKVSGQSIHDSSTIAGKAFGYIKTAWDAVYKPVSYAVGYLAGTFAVAFGEIKNYVNDVWPVVWQAMKNIAIPIRSILMPSIALMRGGIAFTWGLIKTLTVATWGVVKNTVVAAWEQLVGVVKIGWHIVSGTLKAGMQILTGDWSGAWGTIKGMFGNVWSDIKGMFGSGVDWILNLGGVFSDAGRGLVDAFWGGIMTTWDSLKSQVVGIFDDIASLLPHSDADQGPLSHLTASGRAFNLTLAAGMKETADAPVYEATRVFNVMRGGGDSGASASSSSQSNTAPVTTVVQVAQRGGSSGGGDTHLHFNVTIENVDASGGLENLESELYQMARRLSTRLGKQRPANAVA